MDTPRSLGPLGPRAAVAIALTITMALLVASVLGGSSTIVVSPLIAGPLLCGLVASPRATARIALLSIAIAALAFIWNQSFGSWRYWIPLLVVTLGSSGAFVMALLRQRLAREAARMGVLAAVAEIAQGDAHASEMAQSLCTLLTRRLVDLCVIDLIDPDGKIERTAGSSTGDQEVLRRFMARPPSGPETPGSAAAAIAPAAIVHLPVIDEQVRRRLAHDEKDFELLQRLGIESAVIVPLLGRERGVGAVILGTRAPTEPLASGDDVRYAETLAGRIALALDNAVLSEELASAERELEVILGSVDAAIIVRDVRGRMVYANQASADLLKLDSVETIRSSPPHELMDRFDVYTEEGQPVDLEDLPGTRLLAGERDPAPMLVRNVVKATGEERWLLNKATGVADAKGRIAMAVNLIEDVTESKRTEIGQRLLAHTGRALAEASDLSRTLQAIADAAVPGLADWAGIDLVDSRGRIKAVAIAHRDPEKVRLGWRMRTQWPVDPADSAGLPEVIRTGKPQLVRNVPDELLVAAANDEEHLALLREVGLTSTMIAPIRAGARILGALSFVSSTARRFDQRDLELACDLGRQAGVFIDHAQLYSEQVHIARTLQASLIPRSLPSVEHWEVSSAYRAAGRANEVGGDFYDLVRFDGGYAAIIGDVVGKGAEAAALTALARHTLAALIEGSGDGAEALGVLNQRLRERSGEYGSLCTIGVVLITDDDRASLLSAGHPLPLLVRDGEVRLVGKTSPMLGFVDDVPINITPIEILPGDQLVLYTDGVLDAVGTEERFGERRLIDTVARLASSDSGAQADQIVAAVDRFLSGEQSDDIAIVVLSRNAVLAPSEEPEAIAAGLVMAPAGPARSSARRTRKR